MRPGSRGVPTTVLLVLVLASPAFSGEKHVAVAEGLWELAVADRPIPPVPAQVPVEVEVKERAPTKVEFLAILAGRGLRGAQYLRETQGILDWYFGTITPLVPPQTEIRSVVPDNLKIIFKIKEGGEVVAHEVVSLSTGDDLLSPLSPISFQDIDLMGKCVVIVGIPAGEIEPGDVEYVTLAQ